MDLKTREFVGLSMQNLVPVTPLLSPEWRVTGTYLQTNNTHTTHVQEYTHMHM